MWSALAEARRSVAVIQAYGGPLYVWLTSELRMRGIRENAAVIAVMEIPEARDLTVRIYSHDHSDRAALIQDLLCLL